MRTFRIGILALLAILATGSAEAFSAATGGMLKKWSEPDLQSFVLSPEGSRTGPDSHCKANGECTRSRRVVYRFQRIQATAHGSFVAPVTAHCQARNPAPRRTEVHP